MQFSIIKLKLDKNDYYKFICCLDYENEIDNCDLKNFSLLDKLLKNQFNSIDIKHTTFEYTNEKIDNKLNHKFILKKFDDIVKNGNKYFFDIQYAIFDNLKYDGLEYLDAIFDEIHKKEKKDYINSKMWNKYNLYGLKIANSKLNIKKSSEIDNLNTKFDFEFIDRKSDLEEIVKKINFTTNDIDTIKNNFYEFICYTLIPKDEFDVIVLFLQTLFSFDLPIIVRKCEDDSCGKFFICRTGNTKKCERIGKDGLTCSERADIIRRQHEREDPIKKLKKKIKDNFRNRNLEEESYNFSVEDSKKKRELYGNNREYVLWLLEYIDKDKRKEVIDKLGLNKYL